MAQRMHGGAALQHVPLATPGFKGLNTEQAAGLLGPEWATVLTNAVIDGAGRLAARQGWSDQTTTPNGEAFVSGFEYEDHAGNVELLLTSATTVERSTDDGATFSDVTGTAAFTSGDWFFINFADKAIGVQDGEAPMVYSGSTASQISDGGSEPTGGVGCAFGGRLWIADTDGHTLKYCALLDETDWSGTDAGSFDFKNVWNDTDTIQAVIGHNGALVVFGKKNIIFITDGTGSAKGIDPTQAYVVDVLSGAGCINQKTVQPVDGDLWFVGEQGLMSLGRLIQERSNPMDNLSRNVQSSLLEALNDTSFSTANLRSVYSPENRFYLLSLPKASGSTEIGKCWVFDTRARLEDGSARCLGQWDGLVPTVLIRRDNGDILSANRDNTGELFLYDGNSDDGATFGFSYRSGWTDLGAPGVLKIFKRFGGVFFANTATTVGFKWAFDFDQSFKSRTKTFSGADTGGTWDAGLWDTATWGGGTQLREGTVVPSDTGKYIKWGIDVTITGEFSLQQLELYAKLGRMS